ncbi:MAG: terpene utilization protein AtuA [Bradyrhizobium sp.]|nr:terpene utilization protein AtuA [Bradyrhizobium sp.]
MPKVVRIGGACAFYGDSSVAPRQLIEAGVDYLVLDYLAEATMSVLGAMRVRRDTLGYAHDFTEWVWKNNLHALKATGTKIITNAGGVNPVECVRRMEKIAADAGVTLRIAIVAGDDLMDRLPELARSGAEMFSGAPFPDPGHVVTANAYLGATPIARALALGADIVITGRVVDSALTLGALMHEFGWSTEDYDLLAAGSLAGHVIECGAQGSGGLFTDWEDVPDWAHIGYPIVECAADGRFVVTKPGGTGGLVSCAVVAEQILYEVEDPQAYLLPDVVCDFSRVRVEQVGEHRVLVTGATGYPPSGQYKICVTHKDCARCIAFMPVVGRDAVRKAQRQGEAVLTRVTEMLRERNLAPFRASRIEIVGAETSYGANARAGNAREVVCKIGVEHDDPAAFAVFLREFDAPTTSMSVGTTGWFGGRGQVTPVYRVFSTTMARALVPVSITLGAQRETIIVQPPATCFDPATIARPEISAGDMACDETVEVPLIALAWARSGDKGNAFNIGVIARKPAYLPFIRDALSQTAMLTWFAHDFADAACPAVHRYEVPGLNAINLHFIDALGGGQLSSLRLDPLAKAKAQQLLDLPVSVPASLL